MALTPFHERLQRAIDRSTRRDQLAIAAALSFFFILCGAFQALRPYDHQFIDQLNEGNFETVGKFLQSDPSNFDHNPYGLATNRERPLVMDFRIPKRTGVSGDFYFYNYAAPVLQTTVTVFDKDGNADLILQNFADQDKRPISLDASSPASVAHIRYEARTNHPNAILSLDRVRMQLRDTGVPVLRYLAGSIAIILVVISAGLISKRSVTQQAMLLVLALGMQCVFENMSPLAGKAFLTPALSIFPSIALAAYFAKRELQLERK
ncbi:MAG: hypothetical protein RLY93_06005 [Sumerlaeia bacterium]